MYFLSSIGFLVERSMQLTENYVVCEERERVTENAAKILVCLVKPFIIRFHAVLFRYLNLMQDLCRIHIA